MDSPSFRLYKNDVYKALKVAVYVGISAALTSLAQSLLGIDFSGLTVGIESLGLNLSGPQVAMGVANVLLYLGERFVKNNF